MITAPSLLYFERSAKSAENVNLEAAPKANNQRRAATSIVQCDTAPDTILGLYQHAPRAQLS
jgi:hypothetical protein